MGMSARERLLRYYKLYNPGAIASIDTILTVYKGREEEIFPLLEEKYGPEPPPEERRELYLSEFARDHEDSSSRRHENGMDSLINRLTKALRSKTEECLLLAERLSNANQECVRLSRSSTVQRLERCVQSIRRDKMVLRIENEQLQQLVATNTDKCMMLAEQLSKEREKRIELQEEIGSLQLQLREPSSRHEFYSIIHECEERIRATFEARIADVEHEFEAHYKDALRKIVNRDEVIAAFREND